MSANAHKSGADGEPTHAHAKRSGSGATAASAFGEITNDAAVARSIRSVSIRSVTLSLRPLLDQLDEPVRRQLKNYALGISDACVWRNAHTG
jgi:hypothetical protein